MDMTNHNNLHHTENRLFGHNFPNQFELEGVESSLITLLQKEVANKAKKDSSNPLQRPFLFVKYLTGFLHKYPETKSLFNEQTHAKREAQVFLNKLKRELTLCLGYSKNSNWPLKTLAMATGIAALQAIYSNDSQFLDDLKQSHLFEI